MTKLSRNEIVAMTPKQLNEAVAIEKGWKKVPSIGDVKFEHVVWIVPNQAWRQYTPDYCSDENSASLLDDLIARGREVAVVYSQEKKMWAASITVDWKHDITDLGMCKAWIRDDEFSPTRGEAIAKCWLIVVNEERWNANRQDRQ